MDQKEFDELVSRTRMKPRSIRLARSVLVQCMGYTEAAKNETENGEKCSTQSVFRATKRVLREKLKAEGLGSDWECIAEPVPKELVEEIKAEIRGRVDKYKKKLGLKLT